MHYVTVSNAQRYYETRKKSYFNSESCRTGTRENSISVRGPRLWDTLPIEIQNSPTVGLLKRSLIILYINSYNSVQNSVI